MINYFFINTNFCVLNGKEPFYSDSQRDLMEEVMGTNTDLCVHVHQFLEDFYNGKHLNQLRQDHQYLSRHLP